MTNNKINARIFWKNVKTLREEQEITQADMCKTLGISASYYGNLERGIQKTVNREMAERVAEVLKTTVDNLMTGEPPKETVFWKNVKARRLQLGITQEDIAKAIGMETMSYSMKERMSPVNVKLEEAQLIANKLDTTIAELMGRRDMVWNKLSEKAKTWLCSDANIAVVERLAAQD